MCLCTGVNVCMCEGTRARYYLDVCMRACMHVCMCECAKVRHCSHLVAAHRACVCCLHTAPPPASSQRINQFMRIPLLLHPLRVTHRPITKTRVTHLCECNNDTPFAPPTHRLDKTPGSSIDRRRHTLRRTLRRQRQQQGPSTHCPENRALPRIIQWAA